MHFTPGYELQYHCMGDWVGSGTGLAVLLMEFEPLTAWVIAWPQ